MMILVAARYFLQLNYRNYSYLDETRDEAVLAMLKAASLRTSASIGAVLE